MMPQASRGLLFRKRNILGAALVAGIGLGIYLGQFKGWGVGGGSNFGIGTSDGKKDDGKTEDGKTEDGKTEANSNELAYASTDSQGELPVTVPNVVKVLIDDREFLLRQPKEDVPITLSNLIHLTKQAPGDADGFRIRIYEKSSARVSAEEKLKQALADADIPDNAVFWVPTPVKDFDSRRSDSPSNK